MRPASMFLLASLILRTGLQSDDPPAKILDGSDCLGLLTTHRDKPVRIVFQDDDGKEYVCHPRVLRIRGGDVDFLKRNYTTRPGSTKSLVQEYLEKKLQRSLTDSKEDKKILSGAGISVDHLYFNTASRTVNVGGKVCLVLRIEPLDLTGGPPIKPVTEFKVIEYADAFVSNRGNELSAWGIEYGTPGDTRRFKYRFLNGGGKAHIVSGVTLRKAEWMLDQNTGAWIPVIRFTVSHKEGGTFEGYFVLDEHGFAIRGRYKQFDIVDKEYVEHVKRKRTEEKTSPPETK